MSIGGIGSISSVMDMPAFSGVGSLITTTVAPDLFGFDSGSTIVDLSGYGRLLSAVDTFAQELGAMQPGSTSSGLGGHFGTDLASLAAQAQYFVDAVNTLQTNLADLPGPVSLLAAPLIESVDALFSATQSVDATAISNLGLLGITAQPTLFGHYDKLSIDPQVLQSAFSSNASGAFSSLAQASQALERLAGQFIANTGPALPALLATAATTTSPVGLASPLALAAFSPGRATTFTQQLNALHEFNMVYALLG